MACTRACIEKYCEGSLRTVPAAWTNFCEKVVKDNLGESMTIKGADMAEGSFLISELPSLDGNTKEVFALASLVSGSCVIC